MFGTFAATTLLYLSTFANATPWTARACNADLIKHGDTDIAGQYIIRFKDGYNLGDHQKTIGFNVTADLWLYGYTAKLTTDQLGKVRADCGVEFVENNFWGEDDWDQNPQTTPLPPS